MSKKFRKKMCEDCAFRTQSLEMQDPVRREALLMACEHRAFHCHQTMFNLLPEQGKFLGSYDATRNPAGDPHDKRDHQMCAGFVALYGSQMNLDGSDIPLENHHMRHIIEEEREMAAEEAAAS